ncbi:sulfurtransferase [Mesobacillus harenae]|uniref:sulfurtransferase n=1 Tax=Mesobacillus harenae TaxID=2213203 RepID=UPI00157FF36A|nr:sulfurtransferase [Mesobacillus harenae]
MYTLIALITGIVFLLYKRYVPVLGVPCKDIREEKLEYIDIILDIRDYNISSKTPVEGALTIPTAYLARYFKEIPGREIYIVASDHLEKNMGIRLLRKRGFKVMGYTLTDCGC